MTTILAYVDAVPGRLYPLVGSLLELQRRGHRVAVRCGVDDVARLRSAGLPAESSPSRSNASIRMIGGREPRSPP